MGTEEEDGVFVSWWLHGSLWQLIDLNDQEETQLNSDQEHYSEWQL